MQYIFSTWDSDHHHTLFTNGNCKCSIVHVMRRMWPNYEMWTIYKSYCSQWSIISLNIENESLWRRYVLFCDEFQLILFCNSFVRHDSKMVPSKWESQSDVHPRVIMSRTKLWGFRRRYDMKPRTEIYNTSW